MMHIAYCIIHYACYILHNTYCIFYIDYLILNKLHFLSTPIYNIQGKFERYVLFSQDRWRPEEKRAEKKHPLHTYTMESQGIAFFFWLNFTHLTFCKKCRTPFNALLIFLQHVNNALC